MSVCLLLVSILILALAAFQVALAVFLYAEDAQLSPLESGFESLHFNAMISSAFFVLAALFVIFDVELILLFPGILVHFEVLFMKTFGWIFLSILILVTLMMEWIWCGLKWQI